MQNANEAVFCASCGCRLPDGQPAHDGTSAPVPPPQNYYPHIVPPQYYYPPAPPQPIITVPNLPVLPDGYEYKSSLSYKKGKFPIISNILTLIVILSASIAAYFIFPFDKDNSPFGFLIFLGALVLGLVIEFVWAWLSVLIEALINKLTKGGKTKLHFGLVMTVYCEKAQIRKIAVLSLILAVLIPPAILAVIAVFVWSIPLFVAVCCRAFNIMMNIPIALFMLKHDKTAHFHFYNGSLNVFTKQNAADEAPQNII